MAFHSLPASEETWQIGVIDQSIPPVLSVESGDEVVFETVEAWGDRVTPETTLEDVIRFFTQEFPGVGPHTLTGPIEVAGAEPGQLLKVDILKLTPRVNGWNLIMPGEFGTGLLPDDFPEGGVRHYRHDLKDMTVQFSDNVALPLEPMLGILAVAPENPGPHNSIPPGPFGGNLDLVDLREGASLYLPVWRHGALFSAGDAHSRQGSGEVCLTAIETGMQEARVRLTVVEPAEEKVTLPYAETPEAWITVGLHGDLLEASRMAIRAMIHLLGREYGIGAKDAYQLCSLVADVTVTQVVNEIRGVHASISKSIFA